MNLTSIKQAITQGVGRQILLTKKNSPHIFFAVGLGGAIVATVMASRATLKVEPVLEEIKLDIEAAKTTNETAIEVVHGELVNNREIALAYANGMVKITKLYGPAVIVGGVSIACLTGSHVQLTRRNGALMAAYATIQEAYSAYRERVRAEVGEERERDLYLGLTQGAIEGEDGKKKAIKVADPTLLPNSAVFFNQFCTGWRPDPEMNRIFLECQQRFFNQRLHAKGHVFLNEIFDALGMPHTSDGALVGWTTSRDATEYIDFGIRLPNSDDEFLNSLDPVFVLNFNVHGVMYNLI